MKYFASIVSVSIAGAIGSVASSIGGVASIAGAIGSVASSIGGVASIAGAIGSVASAVTPPYTYDGLMIRPTKEWVMFEPYKEFIVGDHICRAKEQPRCTWWNAMLLESMNTSLRTAYGADTKNTTNTTITVADKLFISVPWIPSRRHLEIIKDIDEATCVGACLATNCSAVTWFMEKSICARTHDTVHIDASTTTIRDIRAQKIPMRRSYVVRGHGIAKKDVRGFIDHLVDILGCRLNTFRCAV